MNPAFVMAEGSHLLQEPIAGRDYGVGVDTELIARWRDLLASLRERRCQRLFSPAEHLYCESFPDPAPVYAGSWCAKEAVFKAVSKFCRLSVDQIEIGRSEDGRPFARLPPALRERVEVRVSISHDAERAVAFAVAIDAGRAEPGLQ